MSFVVAIDGPAGAGKSSVARAVAMESNLTLIDTGAIYRCVALECLRQACRLDDEVACATIAANIDVSFELVSGQHRILLGGIDVTRQIRTEEIAARASQLSKSAALRQELLALQRAFADESQGVILEGRDIGTVVFPDANLKVFLFADVRERARRRKGDLENRGESADFDSILRMIQERDKQDSERDIAPLRPAEDAVQMDSTAKPFEDVVADIVRLIQHARDKVNTEATSTRPGRCP